MLGSRKRFCHHSRLSSKDLHINGPANLDTSPYDDRLALVAKILETLGAHHEVSSTGTSFRTSRFKPEMKTLTLIMHSNLYPLSNTGFINLGRAKFLCGFINEAQIDIYAHIFQSMGKRARRSPTRTCLSFWSLIMKIMTLKGIRPPKDGTILLHQGPICPTQVSLTLEEQNSYVVLSMELK